MQWALAALATLREVGSLKAELAKGLRYLAPLPLPQTCGADWDYRGATDVVTHLTLDIEELVRNTDKKPHFLVLAAPGQVALFAGAACICQLH